MLLPLLHDDEALVAVAKPSGLATIPGRGESTCLLEQLGRQMNLPVSGRADPRLRLVHRLDKPTSGILVMAKTIEAQRALSHQFQNNLAQKEYVAIVAGEPQEEQGEIDAPLAVDPARRGRMRIDRTGRPARTEWKVQGRFGRWSLLRVFPKTGKTHQIRVHLTSIGLPLAVDELYNPPPANTPTGLFLSQFKRGYRAVKNELERPLIGRLTLHAQSLALEHPDGRAMRWSAPLPKDFRAVLNMLEKYGRR